MSRTDELRASGAVSRTRDSGNGTGDRFPYVKWGEAYAWLEGQAFNMFETEYGETVSIKLSNCSDNLVVKEGGSESSVQPSDSVNVGIHTATLKGTITQEDVDQRKHFHIAFMRWNESQRGTRYRVFAVLEVAPPGAEEEGIVALKVPQVASTEDDDKLPF